MAPAKTQAKLLTAEDRLRLHSEGVRGKLIRGVLHKTVAAGLEHGEIAVNFGILMGAFIKANRLGCIVGNGSGIRLQRTPDTAREPDLAFMSVERLPLNARVRGYSEAVPNLVVEIISPNDRAVAGERQGRDVVALRRASGTAG